MAKVIFVWRYSRGVDGGLNWDWLRWENGKAGQGRSVWCVCLSMQWIELGRMILGKEIIINDGKGKERGMSRWQAGWVDEWREREVVSVLHLYSSLHSEQTCWSCHPPHSPRPQVVKAIAHASLSLSTCVLSPRVYMRTYTSVPSEQASQRPRGAAVTTRECVYVCVREKEREWINK
jgi:hypothetical protein